jgi:hypothetical protein
MGGSVLSGIHVEIFQSLLIECIAKVGRKREHDGFGNIVTFGATNTSQPNRVVGIFGELQSRASTVGTRPNVTTVKGNRYVADLQLGVVTTIGIAYFVALTITMGSTNRVCYLNR